MRIALTGIVLAAVASMACDLPRDPEGTLARVRGGTLRVGVLEASPWATADAGAEPRGIEAEAVKALAHELGAKVSWVRGSETRHMAALERFELDLVVGGLLASSPYAETVGLTQPYFVEGRRRHEREHVLAVPPGENAWLVHVESYLERRRGELARRIRQEGSP